MHRILQRHGMARLPANQKYRQHTKRWKRYEKQQPGHRLQMDVKFLERIPGTLGELGIRHVYIRPRTPRLNGKVERSHCADAQEFYQLLDQKGVSDDIRLFNAKLRE